MTKRKIIKRRKPVGNPLAKYAGAPIRPAWPDTDVATVRRADAPTPPSTELEHIDNSLRARVVRLEAYNQQLSHLLDKMVGPRPEQPSSAGIGKEANLGGRLQALHNSCNVLEQELDKLQDLLEILNKLA